MRILRHGKINVTMETYAEAPSGATHNAPHSGGSGARPSGDITRRPPVLVRGQEAPKSLVELRGFEPLTPSMRTRCATGLRYRPKELPLA